MFAWCEKANLLFAKDYPIHTLASVESTRIRTSKAGVFCSAKLVYIDDEGQEKRIRLPISYKRFKSLEQGSQVGLTVGLGMFDIHYYSMDIEFGDST